MPSGKLILLKCGLGMAGMVGAFVSILGDITQKDDASAVIKIATTVNENLDLSIPTIGWAMILITLGVVLPLIFEARTAKMAFFTGASVIALIMTATPYEPLPTAPDDEISGDAGTYLQQFIIPADYRGPLLKVQAAPTFDLEIAVTVPIHGAAEWVTLTVLDMGSRKKWRVKLYVKPGEGVKRKWTLPRLDKARVVTVRAEAKAYHIESRSITVIPGSGSGGINIDLRPAARPGFLEKLFNVYKF